MRKGFTPPTHGVGSRIGWPVAGLTSGCQCPGAELGTHWDGPKRRSPCLAAIMASAAAAPAAIPCALKGDSGIASREAAYCDASDCSTLFLPGNATFAGTVETMFARTVYAAVATAASSDAVAANRRSRTYGR